MKIINLDQLNHMPNGTVFSERADFIENVVIMTGHRRYCLHGEPYFNGVQGLHPEFETDDGWRPDGLKAGDEIPADWATVDTCTADFNSDQEFIVLNRSEVQELIDMLQMALTDAYGPNPGDYPKELEELS